MKLTNELNELLTQLIDIESIDQHTLLEGDLGLLCYNLMALYGKTSNQKSHDLIISIMDMSGYSLFSSQGNVNRRSDRHEGEWSEGLISSVEKSFLNEEEFMDLLPINGYFH